MNSRLIVIALGGNAISTKGEEGNIEQQFRRTRETARLLVDMMMDGHEIVITHGNGPQVGSVLRRVELTAGEVYPIPLHLCVANTQASMGFMITQSMNNELAKRGKGDIVATTLITNVEIDPNDPALQNASKPIGKYLTEDEMTLLQSQHPDWRFGEYEKREFRRLVPSPAPRDILQLGMIKRLVEEHELIVCCGGGGIPVMKNSEGNYAGVDAVIDKDRTSSLLAVELGVSEFLIATAVEKLALQYRTPNQKTIDRLTAAEAKEFLAKGEFPAGTMGPKVEAAIHFVEHSPAKNPCAIITNLEHMGNAMKGLTGTRIVRD